MFRQSTQSDLSRPVSSYIKATETLHIPNNLTVVYKPTNSLKPCEHNARAHSKQQIRKIKDSVIEFGFVNPVLITSDGMIVAGHGKVEAAKLLMMEQVPTICLYGLTPDQIRAYILVDNRTALNARRSPDLLKIKMLHVNSLRSSTSA